jgi:hypothetical protein
VENSEGLIQFLASSQRTKIFAGHSASSFITRLHDEWTERHGDRPVQKVVREPEARDRVFLSYASEDKERLEKICEALDEKNILYWFDKDQLKGGDDWHEKIRRNISSCCLFVPFMTKHVLTKDDRYFRTEWDEAVKRQVRFGTVNFIHPVQIDEEVTIDSASVPVDLGPALGRQWMKLDEFLERIVDLYREKQRDRLEGRVVE